MKMSKAVFDRLREAVLPVMPVPGSTGLSLMRERWDAFWIGTNGDQEFRSQLSRDTARGGEGLSDDHIDTALRKIQDEKKAQA